MGEKLSTMIVGCSVLISFIGLFFILKIWRVWKQVDKKLLKARVFLSEKFLIKNWICVFLAGAFIASRRVMRLAELLESPYCTAPMVSVLFDLLGLVIMTLLVVLAYYWYRLVYSSLPSSHAEVVTN